MLSAGPGGALSALGLGVGGGAGPGAGLGASGLPGTGVGAGVGPGIAGGRITFTKKQKARQRKYHQTYSICMIQFSSFLSSLFSPAVLNMLYS